jgi:L-aminopeptidase/D-esterase-like protein
MARAWCSAAPRACVAGERAGSAPMAGMATTIGVVATDAALSKAQVNKLATHGARRTGAHHPSRCTRWPTATRFFALATGTQPAGRAK